MRLIDLVCNKVRQNKEIALILLVCVLTLSCCPKDGVDKSVYYGDYNLTFQLSDSSVQKPITFLDFESKVTLVSNNSTRFQATSFSQINGSDQFTFFFDASIKEEDLSSIEVKLIDYKDQNLNFKTISKTPFQREPENVASLDRENFLCSFTRNVASWLLPQAQALSCSTKPGSVRTFRSGSLIPLSLQPEDP